VLLDEWVPAGKNLTRDESLAELARRYFTGHGPATLRDFMWWSGLVAAEAKAGLEMVKSQLMHEEVDGQSYWMAQTMPPAPKHAADAYLLPGFDEYLLGYTDRSAVLDPMYNQQIQPGKNGMFSPTVVIDGQVVGTWKRAFKKDTVAVTATPFTSFSEAQKHAIAGAAERYAKFVGMSTVVIR
jgi:hypothetical protein